MVNKSPSVLAMVDVPAPGSGGGAMRTLFERVRAEYAEMPGLSVTLPQAQRLWALDRATCEEGRAQKDDQRPVRSRVASANDARV
jgi:hypothetical protein